MTAISAEDLTEIERSGRRCAVCRTGRNWRKLEVVRPDGAEPVVMCAACRTRYGSAPPVREGRAAAAPAEPASPAAGPASRAAEPASPSSQPISRANQPASPGAESTSPAREGRAEEHEDRVKKVLRELPRGEHSTGRIAKAAGLNHAKTLRRLRELEASGGVRAVGKRWSTEPPSTDLEGAFDRLQARTSNIRIVRDRSPIS
ncbi:MAG TPA: hypothetical protein VIH85_03505 [Solirubrobacteraceae bacterium]